MGPIVPFLPPTSEPLPRPMFYKWMCLPSEEQIPSARKRTGIKCEYTEISPNDGKIKYSSRPHTFYHLQPLTRLYHFCINKLLGRRITRATCVPKTTKEEPDTETLRKNQKKNYLPIVHLKYSEPCVLCQLLFLLF